MPHHRPEVRGLNVDAQTRCSHYSQPVDIIAIKMKCCGVYYACKDCHIALADHEIETWPQSLWDSKAVLCGACGAELSITNYLNANNSCPACAASFNPACKNHYHFYFATASV
jgi:uncharacterized CHY-type Zn-finger protein